MTEKMISRYQILDRLGAGGMGEVYKALDTKMRREVALKLLPPVYVQDAERVARFKQEAFTTSALNHPNITTVYEIDEDGGRHFICLEFIAGRSLRQVIRAGKLELRESLDIGVQVAEGLHAAHEAGVVHRDLKPENIMVRPDGIAKILDFGLAKLGGTPEPPSAEAETLLRGSPGAEALTQPGMVLGTVAYMSPEQARGQELDRRSDIFTFGSILLEMVTRKQPFQAQSSVELMHAIIHEAPRPLQELAGEAPTELYRILRKAMAKSPDERYQTVKDMAIDLRALQRDLDSGATTAVHAAVTSGPMAAPRPRSRLPMQWIAVGIVVVGAVAFMLWKRSGPAPAPQPAAMLQISKVTSTGKASGPTFAPNGQFLAYTNTVDDQVAIRVRQLATGSEVEVVPPKPDVGLGNMEFTPDGNWLLYTSRQRNESVRTLWQVSPLGGTPREVLRQVDSAPSFAPDGRSFLFQRALGSQDVRFMMAPFGSQGEATEVFKAPEGALVVTEPVLSPDGNEILYMQIDRGDVLHRKLMILTLASGTVRPVPGPSWMLLGGYDWAPDGKGVYVTGKSSWVERNQVWYVSLDAKEARPLTQGFDEHGSVDLRGDGKALATVRTTVASQLWYVPLEGTPEASAARARVLTHGTDMVGNPRVSPDGTKILFVSEAGGNINIWVMDVDGANSKQLTFGAGQEFSPVWSPDALKIAFGTEREGDLQIWVADADGQNARQVTHQGTTNYGPSWSPDGRWLSYLASTGDSSFVFKIAADGGEPIRLSRQEQVGYCSLWSPDGRTVAAWSQPRTPSPQYDLALFPADGGGEVRTLTFMPRSGWTLISLQWAPDGKAFSTVAPREGRWLLERYPLDGGAPVPLLVFDGDQDLFSHGWSPDGRFVILQRGHVSSDVVLLENLP